MHLSRFLAGFLLAFPAVAGAQQPADSARADSLGTWPAVDSLMSPMGVRYRASVEPLELDVPAALGPFGRLAAERFPASVIAERHAAAWRRSVETRIQTLWGQSTADAFASLIPVADSLARSTDALLAPAPAVDDRGAGALPPGEAGPLGEYADLGLRLQTRIEAKMEKNRNERCLAAQRFNPGFACEGAFQPQFDFQFNVLTGGVVADRIHVNVDYDTQREFDASNNISIYYQGRPDEILHRVEIGNVSFALPPSRFITSGVPSGNYGLQAIGQLGPMRFRTIVARQKGNVVRDRVFTIGDRTLQTVEREIEDYQIEPRRFFFTVDPHLFAGYPDIDILDGARMAELARALADTLRPTRVYLYRLQFGSQPQNPNGPQFIVRGGNLPVQRGQIYDLLREGVDYYIDPSLLWVTLVRPLNVNTERLVVAYRVRIGGRDTVYVPTGGTPDIEFTEEPQYANLVWDPSLEASDPTFDREIRSVYRLGGEDVRRESVGLRIVVGSGAGQEKPAAGSADSYLEMFGMAQPTNESTFDAENRLWPRPGDPNFSGATGGAGSDARIIRDYFVVFPSLEPFSQQGLVQPGNPANDSIYTTPSEYLYSSRRPESVYRLRARYQAAGGGDAGSLMLGSVQLRPNSERITIDGVTLTRGSDYTVDYELGRVTFARGDTLFATPRQVSVEYEENPLFAAAPTSIFGLATEFPLDNGRLGFTVISQSQTTAFTRPTLGFEPASSLLAGVNGSLLFNAHALTSALDALPLLEMSAPSSIRVQGEFATSRPRPNSEGQAFIESFEGSGGVTLRLNDFEWYYSSRPVPGDSLPAARIDTAFAATLAWQNNVLINGVRRVFTLQEIDPQTRFAGQGLSTPEQLLWMTLYPLSIGGLLDPLTGEYDWLTGKTNEARRWRSMRSALGAGGIDVSGVEQLEFWAMVDTAATARDANPVLVLDFGKVSENSLVFAPETLYVSTPPTDSLFRGRQVQGFDSLNTERDPFSRAFNAGVDDTGLPGDVVDTLFIVRDGGATETATEVRICGGLPTAILELGDARANCTVQNGRLDEEDLDLDNVLNLTGAQQAAGEDLLRYIVDMSDRSLYNRVTTCYTNGRADPLGTQCWVQFRLPFSAPTERINSPDVRRIESLRITMLAGDGTPVDEFLSVPIARFRLVGAPWLKRSDEPLPGIAGDRPTGGAGTVIAGLIGTADSSARLVYQPPPGVFNQSETKNGEFLTGRAEINERSLRLLGTEVGLFERAEAFYRFPEGEKNFMGYGELRLWARGRNRGWGENGELRFYVKLGRDPDNFYLYRTPVRSGETQLAWTDVRVDFERLFELRTRVQNAFLQQSPDTIQCSDPVDLALIAASPVPPEARTRYAACEDGYVVYTTSPDLNPPNLAAVHEMAVGIVRVAEDASAPGAILSGDTLEVWVNEIRLTDVLDTPGYAGQLGLAVRAGDVADIRVNITRKDPHFRQLDEQPSFITDNSFDLASSVRLDRFLPASFGLSLPLTVSHSSSGTDPLFLSGSDVRGGSIDDLRTPSASATSYALAVRRVTPVEHRILGPIVNNLSLRSTYSTAGTRSEFSDGEARSWTLGMEYDLAARERTVGLPSWLQGALGALPDWLAQTEAVRSLRTADFRWNPSRVLLSSALARSSDRRRTFGKAAIGAPDDPGRVVEGLSHVWRNTGVIELRPLDGLSLRGDVTSLRDLRNYGDASPTAIVARAERERLFGVDLGLERERNISTLISATPVIATWIRPSISFGTGFTLTRDPNARTPLTLADSLDGTPDGSLRLPRRLTSRQTFSAGAVFDLGGAISRFADDSSMLRRITSVIQPVDVSYTRSLISAFDGTPLDPPLGYQLGLGGVDDFRSVSGRLATSAGVTRNLGASHALSLPFGTSLLSRFNRVKSTNWTRRPGDAQAPVHNSSVTFPDISFRWSFRPTALGGIISSVGSQVGVRHTQASTLIEPIAQGGGSSGGGGSGRGGVAERSSSDIQQYPINGSITWALAGGFSTSGGYSLTLREDVRPGSRTTASTRDVSVDVAKQFRPPAGWNLESDIRVRMGYQQSHSESHAFSLSTAEESRLTDNGRRSFNINADTNFDENLSFSLQGARIVTFDRNYDRRFTQTVITAVLQLDFFAGELR
ncbi:MAG: cell surface protein SprA [Gemmatimonadaceae bacterium]